MIFSSLLPKILDWESVLDTLRDAIIYDCIAILLAKIYDENLVVILFF